MCTTDFQPANRSASANAGPRDVRPYLAAQADVMAMEVPSGVVYES